MQTCTVYYGGDANAAYTKTIIFLHGGGGNGAGTSGLPGYYAGDFSGTKFVFPTSTLDGGIWMETYKNGCGNSEECAYNMDTVN